ncbi:DUF6093 family protein [Glycomyces artemisiae]|uniref:Uncharacterized protein n=1 Tax=Glycomyces artemisiae TaxID=1076443 RepID=A0A2T0UEW8_9ACTN|nr:DUF6093 family protein [Glycomyces artemisiae]PRY56442.1 hypothetical protein B0I28_10991 [Glycomyces artemisiae]
MLDIAAALEAGRAAAEERMVDTCTIRRPTGTVTDPVTAEVTTTYDVLYSGQKCEVQSKGYWGEAREVAEAFKNVLALEVKLPIAVLGLNVDDEITVDASVHEPDLVGRVFHLKDLSHKSHATARRVLCREVTG